MVKMIPASFSLCLVLISTAWAQEYEIDPDYQTCVDRIDADPKSGRYFALRWISDGGGDPAVYCAAIADLAMDLPRMAGGRLEMLAEKNRNTDPYLSARLYVQASQAWVTAQDFEKALALIEAANRMAAGSTEVKLLSAPVYAEAGRWGLVKRALDEVGDDQPLSATALVLRGRAKLELSDNEGAARDVQKALNLEPDNIKGLILRGELAQAGVAIDPYTAR